MTSKQNIGYVVIVFLLFSFLFETKTLGFTDKQTDSILLKNIMEKSGVSIEMAELSSGGQINERSANGIKKFSKQIEETFSVDMQAPEKTCCSAVKVQFNGKKSLSPFASINFKLVGRETSLSNQLAAYLIIVISIDKQESNKISDYYTYLSKNLKTLGLNTDINTSFKGVIGKKMDHKEQYALLKTIFQNINGEIIEGLNEKDLISLSGYSNKLSRFVLSNNKKVNIQMASRYDPLSNNTVLTVGNPVATMSY